MASPISPFPVYSFCCITVGERRFSTKGFEVQEWYEDIIDQGSIGVQSKITEKMVNSCISEFKFALGMEIAFHNQPT